MIKSIDKLGRIVIPKEMRKTLRIKDNSEIEMECTDTMIILTKRKVNKEQIQEEIERLQDLLNNLIKE
jgi:AbrB family looped-hinge helix DNA binding protein